MTTTSGTISAPTTIERRRRLVADQPMGEFHRRLAAARAAVRRAA